MIKAYFIGIGNELLQGKIQDKNLHWLGRFLFKNNIYLKQSSQVRDEPEDLIAELEQGWSTTDILITTGGLGPTEDDMTKSIVAKWLDLSIKESEEAKRVVLKQFEEKGRSYDEKKFDYHQIPEDFKAIHNRVGYAPGLLYQKDGKTLLMFPGVPSEFQAMVEDHLLSNTVQTKFLQENLIFKTWGLPESHIFHKIEPELWENLKPYGTVSSLPHLSGVDIGVTVQAKDQNELEKTKRKVDKIMRESKLSDHIWHIGEQTIEGAVHEKLIALGKTLATAESCTGGLIADKLTNFSGSSAYFNGTAVTYATESKVNVLGVSSETIEKYNVVSEQVAGEMAKHVRKLYQSDYALTTTGVAGPSGGSAKIPVGTVCIGIASDEKVTTQTFHLKGNRRTLKIRFAEFALHSLLREIE